MEAVTSGPHLPLGLDSGLDDLFCEHSFLRDFDMTAFPFDDEPMLWESESPHETVSSGGAKSQSHHASGGGSSRSPTVSSLIFTPTSTQLDFQDGDGYVDPGSEEASTSPESSTNNVDGYVYVRSIDGDSMHGNQGTGTRSTTRNAPSSSRSRLSPRSLYSTPTDPPKLWQTSFTATSSFGMDDSASQPHNASSTTMERHAGADSDLLSNVGGFDNSFAGQHYQGQGLPFRDLQHGNVPGTSFGDMAMLSPHISLPQSNSYTGRQHQNAEHAPVASTLQPRSAELQARNAIYNKYLRSLSQSAGRGTNETNFPSTAIEQPHPQSNSTLARGAHPASMGFQQQPIRENAGAGTVVPVNRSSSFSRLDAKFFPPQAVNALMSRSTGAMNHSEPPQRVASSNVRDHADRVRKGGRSRNSHLSEKSRVKSSVMRKVGACWRCALQRDPCDHGDPCSRCTMRSQKGQTYFFDCDRSKLPDFVHDFLPPSMTVMHQKQTIEDSVASSVLAWDHHNGIDIYLSTGYGPPLRWKVFEFKPRTDEYLHQLQYYQDYDADKMACRLNYSPPYGLLKIDPSDDAQLDSYLETLLDPQLLWDFAWTYYEAECIADTNMFQAGVLDLMCTLYVKTNDRSLKNILHDVLRMLLITFIMGHTLTISEDTIPTVIANIRHSRKPSSYDQKFTSPKLANRQLKFFFAVLRNGIYEKLLKWQQQTLHTAGKKDQTWLPAFCVTLGFAMVLEELQHTLFIQADSSVSRGEMTAKDAYTVANNACERTDARFRLLVGLFQCKYRDKKWGDNGSFGPGTPEVKDYDSQVFLAELREMIIERWDHLKSRENVTFSKENQCQFTSRLTAKFLVPFLNLPG